MWSVWVNRLFFFFPLVTAAWELIQDVARALISCSRLEQLWVCSNKHLLKVNLTAIFCLESYLAQFFYILMSKLCKSGSIRRQGQSWSNISRMWLKKSSVPKKPFIMSQLVFCNESEWLKNVRYAELPEY